MIKSFACKETEKVFNRIFSKRLPESIQALAMQKLWILHATTRLVDLRIPPSNQLEVLKGDRKGRHSIRINKQWRICFYWRQSDAYEVEIVDYH